ncbi:ribosome small subunit-dependent GTPase A [Gottfriedia solisilvae]|uniref:Small ribosomal subunit biogenesis GTPase RsgA n=1 Tax=Gottfriedia solisilvae TaxID=1516104 RepID=A0A8J3AP28_9BACI|nr:ribosome small subunit-dependent GTPase A [Gottfriedia solisilvae]GGI14312.1 putative ribosome biogenesis GTPase RsgA [Gottfriedia solisilvae]
MPEGKIIKALSGFYYIETEDTIVACRGRGNFRNKKITPLVGDEAVYSVEKSGEGYLLEIKDRKNELVRPPIANVDQAILVFSAVEPNFSPNLLDRFLVLIEFNEIKPLIVITKIDLCNETQLQSVLEYVDYYRQIGYEVCLTSSKTEEGLEKVLPHLADKISVFAGQSGVGKSTLLNAINPELDLKTGIISTHLGRGKHTTRHVELIKIGEGLVADTPGFSSLEFIDIEAEDLSYCFIEMREKSQECKFRGCTHLKEPKCAVKEAVENGEITTERYNHYVSFIEEIRDRKPRY